MKFLNNKPLLNSVIYVFVLLLIIEIVARMYDLYFQIYWLDFVTHFLGGLLIFLALKLIFPKINLFYSFLSIFLISVVWEVLELILGNTNLYFSGYGLDTTFDFIFAFIGAIAGIYIYELIEKSNS